MIGRLRGVVAEVGEDEALIDVSGVGYLVRCGARTLGRLPAPGGEALLHIESQWTETAGLRLHGFLDRAERGAFAVLTGVQGVGPKAAMAVLDVLSPAELATAVARDDKAGVARAQGVGPKLALRIITELKDKPIAGAASGGLANVAAPAPVQTTVQGDAVAGLMGLGLAEAQARRAVELASHRLGEPAAVAALIKAALQELDR